MRKSLWKLLNLNCADRKNHISMYHIWSLYINKLKACENRGMVPRNTKHKAPSLCMSSQATGCLSDSSRSLTFHMLGEKLSAAIARSYPGWTEFPSQTASLTLIFWNAAVHIKHLQGETEREGKLGLYPVSTDTIRLLMRGFTVFVFESVIVQCLITACLGHLSHIEKSSSSRNGSSF